MKLANAPSKQVVNQLNLSAPTSIPIHWLIHLFGCWHINMGTPFTRGSQSYRTCMKCGAHRKFDMALWKNVGPFYREPVLALYNSYNFTSKINKTSYSKGVSSFELARWAEDGGNN